MGKAQARFYVKRYRNYSHLTDNCKRDVRVKEAKQIFQLYAIWRHIHAGNEDKNRNTTYRKMTHKMQMCRIIYYSSAANKLSYTVASFVYYITMQGNMNIKFRNKKKITIFAAILTKAKKLGNALLVTEICSAALHVHMPGQECANILLLQCIFPFCECWCDILK